MDYTDQGVPLQEFPLDLPSDLQKAAGHGGKPHEVLLNRLMTLRDGLPLAPAPRLLDFPSYHASPNMRAMAIAGDYWRCVVMAGLAERRNARVRLLEFWRYMLARGHQAVGSGTEQMALDPHAGMWLSAMCAAVIAAQLDVGDDGQPARRETARVLGDHLALNLACSTAEGHVVAPGARPGVPPTWELQTRFVQTAAGNDKKFWREKHQQDRYYLGWSLARRLKAEHDLPAPNDDWRSIKLACPMEVNRYHDSSIPGFEAHITVPPGVQITAHGTTRGTEPPLLWVRVDGDTVEYHG